MILKDKVLLLLGGTGSFGQEFCKIVLQKYSPKVIRIYSRSEFLQWEMQRKFNSDKLRFLIGDIRDKSRLWRASQGVDIIIHAAALKQIPTAEYNPIEAVLTNIMGAINIIDCAIDNKVDKVLCLSTDKAAHPVNLYGMTKATMERLVIQANSYSGEHGTKFSCTRYGNVSNSRGSVIPLFIEQKKKGCLTITDNRMTRFWMTLEQSVNLVLLALSNMKGGEIFVPKLPSVYVKDIAEAIGPYTKKREIGIRPGEKLYESLITEEEIRNTKDLGDYMIIEPDFPFWDYAKTNGIPIETEYRSDKNSEWINVEKIKEFLKNDVDML